MNRLPRLSSMLAIGSLCATIAAQTPSEPPRWWGVQDEVTVSLAWDFDNGTGGLPPQTPDFQVAPSWYQNPTPWSASGDPLQFLGTYQGHTGVYALVGNNSPLAAGLALNVDNDPHLDWVKLFWLQYDEHDPSGVGLSAQIREQLSKYGRAVVTEEREAIGNGWDRVTISAELIPQPDDEAIDWSFSEAALGTVAIDNVFVNSRCVKPRPDEDGEALGKVVAGTQQGINLTLVTGRVCRAVAVTRGNAANPGRRLWVSAIGLQGQTHEVFELTANGQTTVNTLNLPTTVSSAPFGPMDMATETVRLPTGGFQEWVYVLVRLSTGDLVIRAIDAQANAIDPAKSRTIPAGAAPFASGQQLGLAFDPDGDGGNGSFWVTGLSTIQPVSWRAFEYAQSGVPVAPINAMDIPTETRGFDYDPTLGNFYCFSSEPVPRPNGPDVQVNGYEIAGNTMQPTGVRFCGDLTIPNPGGPDGGIASGMTVYRTFNGIDSEVRFACVADVGTTQFYYELAGPYRYGYSRFGTIGMQNGPPFLGGSFDVTLRGVPNSLLAALFVGDADANLPIGVEAFASINAFVNAGPFTPVGPGRFSFTVALPPTAALSYYEAFFQWVVLDGTAPGFLGFTQAGKTVLYP
ncbi:MAG: hypothetical protein KAI24_12950 [Planctomycetes bacterium]|nr:hypothetical protein [Planctomycetota bacterium]